MTQNTGEILMGNTHQATYKMWKLQGKCQGTTTDFTQILQFVFEWGKEKSRMIQ